MTLKPIAMTLIAIAAVAAAPPLEAASEKSVQAERRVRACLSTSSGDGHASYEAALLSVRAACKPQIDDLRDVRVIEATAGLGPDAARVVERRVTRALNDEIAHAVANFTGLPVPHAQGPNAQDR